jgi:hypothetical protein
MTLASTERPWVAAGTAKAMKLNLVIARSGSDEAVQAVPWSWIASLSLAMTQS